MLIVLGTLLVEAVEATFLENAWLVKVTLLVSAGVHGREQTLVNHLCPVNSTSHVFLVSLGDITG